MTRRGDELARQRRELPWVVIEKEHRFETDDGAKSLPELFDGRSQLAVYNFMFGPDYEAGCPVCSSMADGFDAAIPHLNQRDVTFLSISRAPLAKLQAYKERMGWQFPWASSSATDFNFDMEASRSREAVAPFVEAGLPPIIDELAAACGTDAAGYISEGRSSARSRWTTASSTTRTRPPRAESNS
jgi:predicted dithiol-disulfide oxidoreductase (DUF899 family)